MKDDLLQQLDSLSAEDRELVELLLAEDGGLSQDTAIRPHARPETPYPLSFAQERLWFLEQLNPGRTNFVTTRAFRFVGPLDIEALELSLHDLVRRHEILRTVYGVEDGRPLQFVQQPSSATLLQRHDVSGIPAAERELAARQIMRREARTGFDLTRDLMIRPVLVSLGDDEYILSVAIHHIAVDGWSQPIVMADLSAFYSAHAAGKPVELHPAPVTYADYAVWQREWFDSPAADRAKAYWQNQLRDAAVLDLPVDRPRSRKIVPQGGRASILVPAQLVGAVESLSRNAGCTVFMTLLAALQLLLARLSGLEDVLVGAPTANRTRPELVSLLGIAVNTLVLRTDLSGNPSFLELLRRVHRMTLDAYDHQDLPFEAVLQLVQPERDLSQTPLFRVFLNNWELPEPVPTLGDIVLQMEPQSHTKVNFDITLYARRLADQIRLSVVYNADLFDQERIEAMLQQYQFLLQQIVEDPGRSIGDYSLVTESMQDKLPDPRAPLDRHWPGSIADRLAYWAQSEPERTAVASDAGSWTYRQLDDQVNRLAMALQEAGVGLGDAVAVYADRRLQLVAAILAVLRAGAAYFILAPDHPRDRLLAYLREARPKAWIDCAPGSDPLYELWGQPDCVRLSALRPPAAVQGTPGSRAVEVGPDDLAVITYTSGSTGQPKGVLGRHGSLTHFLPWQAEAFQLDQNDRFSMLSGLAHDPLQREIFTSIWAGGSLHIPSNEEFDYPGQLLRWLHRRAITFAHLTPPMLRYMLSGADRGPDLAALRYVFFTGDRLLASDVENLRRVAPQATAINSFGTTETQRAVGMYLIPPELHLEDQQAALPAGNGIPDAQLLILNGAGDLAGVGELGEIYVRSPHLALGYLRDPSLTAQRFVASPWSDQGWDRLYRTGDMGRYLPDGKVQVLDRYDQQVKVRGFRVELAEVENTLRRHPAIRNCHATTHQNGPEDRQLVVYYVADTALTPGDVRGFMRQKLPDFMVPAAYIPLDALPLTPSGKVDRRSLPAPDDGVAVSNGDYAPPGTPAEERLATVWAEVLGLDRVGIHDNFFEIGGHSLLGIRLFARIEEAFGQRLPLSLLFSAPTVAQLAGHLAQPGPAGAARILVPIQAGGERAPFFCVHGFGGGVLGYADLARLLGPDRPFYGLQAQGLDGDAPVDATVEAMATRYIAAMHEVQPHGPYRVGGYCLGGVVAFEMARQLEAAGESVALVAIMEGYAPRRYQRRTPGLSPQRWQTVWQNIPFWLDDYWSLGLAGVKMLARRQGSIWRRRVLRRLGVRVDAKAQDVVLDDLSTVPDHHRRLMEAHLRALHTYAPGPIRSAVTLYAAQSKTISKALFSPADPEHGWGALAGGGVDVKRVDGTHRNIHLQPYVRSLAAALQQSLQAVEDAGS